MWMSWNNESNPWMVVPDPTAHIQGSSGVRASMGQGCLGSKREANSIFGTWSCCYTRKTTLTLLARIWHKCNAALFGIINQ